MQNQSTFSPSLTASLSFPRSWRYALAAAACLALGAPVRAQSPSASAVDAGNTQPLSVTELAYGLRQPWALAPLPNGDFLVSERAGSIRVVDAHGRVGPPLQGVPQVASEGQGGLLDLVLDRGFEHNRRVFFCFSEPDPTNASRSSTALASATLSERADRLQDVRVLFHQMPRVRSGQHFGCRIAQAEDGSLFLTLGDRSIAPEQAQRASNHIGTIVRLQAEDGRPHPDNPFFKKPGGLPEVWSWGHRNALGIALDREAQVWAHEMGPQGGDELNLIRAGANYGWPLETFGRNPNMGQSRTRPAKLVAPVHYWRNAIQPSGMVYVESDRYGPQWQQRLVIGSLNMGVLVRLHVQGETVLDEAWFGLGKGQRVRDVRQGPDGLLYVLTDGPNGRLLRVDPPVEPQPATQEPGQSLEPPQIGPWQPASGESSADERARSAQSMPDGAVNTAPGQTSVSEQAPAQDETMAQEPAAGSAAAP